MSHLYSNTRPEVAASEAMTLPQRYYTDPEWFQREMEAIHFDMWLCAGRTSQISGAGDYFLRQFGNASVIITRDEQGRNPRFSQRLPPSRNVIVQHRTGQIRRADPMPVSRLDIQAGRHAGQCSAHGKGAGLLRS